MKSTTLLSVLMLYTTACSPVSATQMRTYEGELPECGKVSLTTYERADPPRLDVSVKCEQWYDPSLPFQQYRIYDNNGDGQFDEGSAPFRPKGTNISMSRKLFSDDPAFTRLENIVKKGLVERDRKLKQVKSKTLY